MGIASLGFSKRGLPAHTPVSTGAEGKCQLSLVLGDIYSHSSKVAFPSFAPTFPIYPAVEQLIICLSL